MNSDGNFKQSRFSRRRFVQGLVAGGVLAGFDLWRWPAMAMRSIAEPAVLTGSHFDLVIDETPVNFTVIPSTGLPSGSRTRPRTLASGDICRSNRVSPETFSGFGP